MTEREYISLLDLQTALKEGLEQLCPDFLWVRAEIASLQRRSGGHCYLELSESDAAGRLLCKVRAVVWANVWSELEETFRAAGVFPQVGMESFLLAKPSYSPLYGLSLVVTEMDLSHALGEQELRRRQTLEHLRREGLLERQKSLQLPRLPYEIAVISAPDAAGYQDFCRHLEQNPYGFCFHIRLFPALMQGEGAPASIIDALGAVLEEETPADVVVLTRGGGARLDMLAFDDGDLAEAIARYPLPLISAVGHERDLHVCDEVAFDHVKTPTALADRFVEMYADEDARLENFGQRLRLALERQLSRLAARLDVLEARILGADPRKVLSRGYSLTLGGDGRVLKQAVGAVSGERVDILFRDGALRCEVLEVNLKENDDTD